jgi:ribosomal protein L31E
MDSKLNLESTYGTGSNFFFTIKLRKANEVKIVNQAKSIVNKISPFENMESKKILIVEDNKINMF